MITMSKEAIEKHILESALSIVFYEYTGETYSLLEQGLIDSGCLPWEPFQHQEAEGLLAAITCIQMEFSELLKRVTA